MIVFNVSSKNELINTIIRIRLKYISQSFSIAFSLSNIVKTRKKFTCLKNIELSKKFFQKSKKKTSQKTNTFKKENLKSSYLLRIDRR